MTFLIDLPFVLIAIRVIGQLVKYISSNRTLSVVLASFAFVIPIFWILLGYNIKLITPLSENTARYPVGEPRLDYYTLQSGQERIEFNLQDPPTALNPYGNCSKCGKPRISSAEMFCSNCGNRF